MKFMLLIYFQDSPRPRRDGETNEHAIAAWEQLPPGEQQAVFAAWQELNEIPGLETGRQLEAPGTARTVRVEDGETLVTDGPFAETKEALGGYFLLEADDLDAAVEIASRVPTARFGGSVEVRPIAEW